MLVQMLYMPMLFLSGATIPTVAAAALGADRRAVHAGLLPGHRLSGHLLAARIAGDNWPPAGALLVTIGLAIFLAMQLFRWEKEEKLRLGQALGAACAAVRRDGLYQSYSKEQPSKNRMLWRDLQRCDSS